MSTTSVLSSEVLSGNFSTSAPSSINDAVNNTGDSVIEYCKKNIEKQPRTNEFFNDLPVGGYVLVAILIVFTTATLAIYAEEVVFLLRNFKNPSRRQKTMWILAFFPVFSVCAFLAVVVPRSGTLVDLVSNTFFGSCLYTFGRLMINYMGGVRRVWQIVPRDRYVKMNTPPCCCCCVCLPQQLLTDKLFLRISLQVLQVAVVRPIIMFLAAILWTNESYLAGDMSPYNGFIYITTINIVSSCVAVWGLMLMRSAFHEELEKDFGITGKILSIQLTLLSTALPNIIIGILVTTNVIGCNAVFSSKARGEVIYHCLLVLLMLPFSLLARHFFCRVSDSSKIATPVTCHEKMDEQNNVEMSKMNEGGGVV